MMWNWKTALAGFVAALSQWSKAIIPVEFAPIADGVMGLAFAILGYFAADKTAVLLDQTKVSKK